MQNKQSDLLESLESGFRIERNSIFKDMVNYSPRADAPIHRWFKYREGYSIDVIDKLILGGEKRMLDPFCGCGSTLLSGKKNGIESIGIDINPVSAFVSKVKTRNYSSRELRAIPSLISKIVSSNSKLAIKKPELSILDKAFHPEILDQLLKLKYRLNQIEEEKIREFALLAFLSIIEPVSNTFKEGNGIKYRFTKRTKQGYRRIPLDKWYKSNLPQNKVDFVNRKLCDQVNLMVADNEKTKYPDTNVDVINGDSRSITKYVGKESVSLCVFSPPYCNCFDYFEIFKLELWIGEFVKGYEDLRSQRRRSLRSNINADLSQELKELDFVEDFVELIHVDKVWNSKIPLVVRGYFTDMDKVLREIFEVLRLKERCIIIVGNSAYGGVLIPTDILLARIAKDVGLDVEEIIVARHLTTSSQQKKGLEPVKDYLRESLVCLRK